jgi:hypothetical protein
MKTTRNIVSSITTSLIGSGTVDQPSGDTPSYSAASGLSPVAASSPEPRSGSPQPLSMAPATVNHAHDKSNCSFTKKRPFAAIQAQKLGLRTLKRRLPMLTKDSRSTGN